MQIQNTSFKANTINNKKNITKPNIKQEAKRTQNVTKLNLYPNCDISFGAVTKANSNIQVMENGDIIARLNRTDTLNIDSKIVDRFLLNIYQKPDKNKASKFTSEYKAQLERFWDVPKMGSKEKEEALIRTQIVFELSKLNTANTSYNFSQLQPKRFIADNLSLLIMRGDYSIDEVLNSLNKLKGENLKTDLTLAQNLTKALTSRKKPTKDLESSTVIYSTLLNKDSSSPIQIADLSLSLGDRGFNLENDEDIMSLFFDSDSKKFDAGRADLFFEILDTFPANLVNSKFKEFKKSVLKDYFKLLDKGIIIDKNFYIAGRIQKNKLSSHQAQNDISFTSKFKPEEDSFEPKLEETVDSKGRRAIILTIDDNNDQNSKVLIDGLTIKKYLLDKNNVLDPMKLYQFIQEYQIQMAQSKKDDAKTLKDIESVANEVLAKNASDFTQVDHTILKFNEYTQGREFSFVEEALNRTKLVFDLSRTQEGEYDFHSIKQKRKIATKFDTYIWNSKHKIPDIRKALDALRSPSGEVYLTLAENFVDIINSSAFCCFDLEKTAQIYKKIAFKDLEHLKEINETCKKFEKVGYSLERESDLFDLFFEPKTKKFNIGRADVFFEINDTFEQIPSECSAEFSKLANNTEDYPEVVKETARRYFSLLDNNTFLDIRFFVISQIMRYAKEHQD